MEGMKWQVNIKILIEIQVIHEKKYSCIRLSNGHDFSGRIFS
jgi:hypothetical protein